MSEYGPNVFERVAQGEAAKSLTRNTIVAKHNVEQTNVVPAASFLTRVVDKIASLPKSRRLAMGVAAASLATACAQVATEPVAEPSNTVSVPGSLEQPSTSNIPAIPGGPDNSIPSSSTTEAPPPTVPETTPTTLDPKEDITKATGDIYVGDKKLTKLGFVYKEEEDLSAASANTLLVKPVSLNLREVEYQGSLKEVYTLSVSAGRYEDGSPYIREFMLDSPGEFNGFFASRPYTRNFYAEDAFPNEPYPTFESQELVDLINNAIEEHKEIGINIPYYISNSFTTCGSSSCQWYDEAEKRIEYNNNTVDDLIKQSENGIVRTEHEGESEIGSGISILIFPPVGGW